jgi:hypothetical protein
MLFSSADALTRDVRREVEMRSEISEASIRPAIPLPETLRRNNSQLSRGVPEENFFPARLPIMPHRFPVQNSIFYSMDYRFHGREL